MRNYFLKYIFTALIFLKAVIVFAEPVSIAVLPYSNLTGSEDYSWLRESLSAEINNSMRERFKFTEVDASSVSGTFDAGKPISEKDIIAAAETLSCSMLIFGEYKYGETNSEIIIATHVYSSATKSITENYETPVTVSSNMFSMISDISKTIIDNLKMPNPSTGLLVSKGSVDSVGVINLSWNNGKNAESYIVMRAVNGSESIEIARTVEPNYIDSNVKIGEVYDYSIISAASGGLSKESKPDFGYLPLPTPEVSSKSESDGVVISWKSIDGIERYKIFRSELENDGYVEISESSLTEYKDAASSSAVISWYKVKAVGKDDRCVSEFSIAISSTGQIGTSSDFSGSSSSSKKFDTSTGYYTKGLVPGWAQYSSGSKNKGYLYGSTFIGFSAGWLVSGLYYFNKKSEYESLNTENTSKYDAAFSSYKTSGYIATGFMICTILSYSANWIDIAFFSDNDYLGGNFNDLRKSGIIAEVSSYDTKFISNNTVYNFGIIFRY